jgi:hypothetical protein
MFGTRRAVVAVGVTAAALLAVSIGSAATSPTYTVTGVEVTATSLEGTFVGTGAGSGGDNLVWRGVVDHDPLSTDAPAGITGGSLAALSFGAGSLSTLTGVFTGGTVTYDTGLSSTAPCGNQVYDVAGSLALTSGSSTGTGTFQVYLTHYRIAFLGRCLTYRATVSGAPGLTISLPSGGGE